MLSCTGWIPFTGGGFVTLGPDRLPPEGQRIGHRPGVWADPARVMFLSILPLAAAAELRAPSR